MNDKVKAVLNSILDCFKSGDIPEAIAKAMFPSADTPSSNWSLLNRTLVFLSGTADARGYRQWQSVNRHVVKGAKAIHILVPYIKKEEDRDTGDTETRVLKGFGIKPVFRVEDTDGATLDYQQISVPVFPLIDRAEKWGISVKTVPGNTIYYGYFSPDRKEIGLATPAESTFFHELAHAAHEKINGGLKGGQDPFQEIVAELSGQALCRIVGKQADTTGNSYRYIENYAKKLNMSAHAACLKVMADTEKVLNLILHEETQGEATAKAA
ncbi:MAG: ArdC family protein [Desulfobulbaceae bacterium]|nr:ArdC family protein [Desulfobulbaceae bacterium]